MVSIRADLTSRTGLNKSVKEILRRLEDIGDGTGDVYGSIGHLQKQIDAVSAMISGLSSAVQGLQRLGLHDMTVTIGAPTSGSVLSNSVTLSGSWTDQSGHTAISGSLFVSGVFITGLTFPASGYWQTTLDTTRFDNGWIPATVQVICAVGTSKESDEVLYRTQNQIAAGGTTQQGETKAYGDKVSLVLKSPGQAEGSFTVHGTFTSSQGHQISSIHLWGNNDKIQVGAAT